MIPAHPLALTPARRLDERRQRALTRYYLAAGAGGLAVGVHTTQFAIHEPARGLLKPVLQLAAATTREQGRTAPVLIAGVVGGTRQAVREAMLARDVGYDAVLLAMRAFRNASSAAVIKHVQVVADIMPVVGFYLQPAVGGRRLDYAFWRAFADIENVVAIKVAPFDRYATLDVIRAVSDAGRHRDITLYTGNDDHIILDLLTRHRMANGETIRFAGGLLGHWAFWTRTAVVQHRTCSRIARSGATVPSRLLSLAADVTDANAAVFDAANGFAGCIPGIHEVLRRQGLLRGRWCLDPHEQLSPGQLTAIDRVGASYPHLADDEFVAAHLAEWLA